MRLSFEFSRNKTVNKDIEATSQLKQHLMSWFGTKSIVRTENREELKLNGFTNPYVYMVTSRISKTVSRLNYDFTINDKPINSGYVVDLMKRPNKNQYFSELFEAIALELVLMGESIVVFRKSTGYTKPQQIDVLKSQYVNLIVQNGEIIRYDYASMGKVEQIPPDQVLHIRFANPLYSDERSLRGFSPLTSLELVTNASNSGFNAEASIMENRGVAGFISGLSENMPLMKSDRDELQQQFDNKNAGSDKFGKIAIVSSPSQFVQVGASSTDLQLLDSNVAKLRVICSVYGLSSQIFGDVASSIYSNMETATKSSYTECYIPLANFICDQFNKFFTDTLKDKTVIKLDIEKIDVMKTINKELSDKVSNEVKTGILSPQQAIEILYPNLLYDKENAKAQTGGANSGQAGVN